MHTVARGFRGAQHVAVLTSYSKSLAHVLFRAHGQFPFSAHLWVTLLWLKGEFHLSARHLTGARQGCHPQAPGECLKLSFLFPKLSWVASACRGHLSLSSLPILQGYLLGVLVADTPFTGKTSVVLTQVHALISLNFSSCRTNPLLVAVCLVASESCAVVWSLCCPEGPSHHIEYCLKCSLDPPAAWQIDYACPKH